MSWTLVQSGLNYSTAHISLDFSRSNIKRIQTLKLKNDIGHYFGRQLDRNLVIKKWKKKTILW